MKRLEKKKVKNTKLKKKSIIKPKKEKVLVVAQEFKFARLLSGNEKKTRDRVLKTLKKWLLNCFEKGYEFKEDDFIRVWKGLFYAVWMSDKPLVQEELCDNISEILDLFPVEQVHHAVLMMKAGFRVLGTEWYGLDQHRMDKFLMLVRRYLRGGWRCLRRADWSLDACNRFVDMLTGQDGLFAVKTPSFARNSLSLMLHIIDCYLEELSKISEGSIPLASMASLLRPFTLHVRCDTPLSVPARRLLTQLITQTDLGLEYEQKTRAWKKMGCPPGGPDALELMEDEEDDEQDDEEQEEVRDDGPGPLDPRAGRVSVLLTPLPVPGAELAEQLRGAATSHRAKRRAQICAERFLALSSSEYPLKVSEDDIPEAVPKGVSPGKAAKSLVRLERSLGGTTDELALKAMSKKHRKKLLAKARAGLSIVEEVTPGSRDGEWQVEEAEDIKDEDKENLKKNKKRKRKMKNDQEDGIKKQRVTGDDVRETSKYNENNKKSITEVKKKKRDKAKIKIKKDNERKVSGGDARKAENSVKQINEENKTKTQKDGIENRVRAEVVTTEERKNDKINKVKEKKRNENESERVTPSKVKNYQKATQAKKDSPKKVTFDTPNMTFDTPKKVKFVLKKNSMQLPGEYYRSVQRSPDIPYDGTRQPAKTNLKPSTPSPINPFFKKYKLKIK